MEAADHQMNYKMSLLPVGGVLALASIAAVVLYVVYAVEWHDTAPAAGNGTHTETNDQYTKTVRTEYSYYGAVLALLCLLVFFNGYHLTRM